MSETQARPSAPRGRGSGRGRSGYSSRGSRGSRHTTNGTKSDHVEVVEDEGEIGELKKKYSSQLNTIKEMFPDWTQEDLVFALQETDGDIESTIERITEGTVSQWGEVKKKDRSRSKVKDVASAGATDSTTAPPGRGSRGRGGVEGSRGGRSRGSERGRGGGRGARGGSVVPTSGSRPPKGHAEVKETPQAPVAADEHNTSETSKVADSWESTPSTETTADGWVSVTAAPPPKVTPEPQKSSIVGDGPKKSWASIFSKPVIPPIPKKVPAATPKALGPSTPGPKVEHETLPLAPAVAEASDLTEAVTPTTSAAEPVITPSKDELTETNLEQLPDVSGPAPSATEASTVATSKDPRGTPFSGTTLQETSRPPTSGYAVSAFKATGSTGRTSSFQRRVLDQQEAVIMPGNHAVDRTAVQFGSLGLNGAGDDPDVDDDREEAETRAQPPQHSPVAHPRASLPPVSQAQPVADTTTPTQAPGLPAAPSQPQSMTSQQPSSQAPLGSQMMAQQISQGNHQYSQFGRYNQQSLPQEQASSPPKAYDAFGQPSHAPSQQSELDGYPSHTQAGQSQMQPSQQSHIGTQSSAGSDYPSYYTSDNNSRGGFSNYYQSPYGHQDARSSLDVGGSQQRAASGFGQTTADSTSQYPSSQAPQPQSRYAQASDIHNSGQNTPNSTAPGQQPPQSTQGQQPHLQQGQGQAGGAYPYTHPYYNQYYSAYMNQYPYGQGGYGAPFAGKGGIYGQHHQGYSMSPQASYEHSSSPANIGGFVQPSGHGRDSGLGGGLGEYGRSGSAQAQTQQQSGSAAFGGMPDVFGRSGFQGQNQQQGGQQTPGEDALKPFSDPKPAGGPSPSLGQPGRPGSASQSAPGQQGHSGLPPPQSQQSQPGFGGYPNHLNQLHGSQGGQYGGLGGLGGHQGGHQGGQHNHQSSGYGGYGSQFGNYYGSGSGRGGWSGGNYGH